MLYETPKNLLEKRINEALGKCEENIVVDLMKLSLLKTAEKDDSLLIYTEIFNLLGPDKFTSLISLLDGRSLKLPSKECFKENTILALCYYYRMIEKKSWEDIKNILGIQDLNTIKIGIHIGQMDAFLNKMIQKGIQREENDKSQQ